MSSKISSLSRIRILAVLIFLFSGLLLSRLFFLQVVKTQYYRDMADRQYLRPAINLFNRGEIFFTAKDGGLVSAATTKQGFTIAINPKVIENATTTLEVMSEVFTRYGQAIDSEIFLAKAGKRNDPYEEVANRISEPVADEISALSLQEAIVSKDRWRYYPASTTASHVIGFMGFKGDLYTGRYGLEKYYNDVLSRDNKPSFVSFFAEIYRGFSKSNLSGDVASSTRPEGDVVLTIEPNVQTYLETVLSKAKEKYSAELTGGIVMDPKTGDIIAMGAQPNFNPGEKQVDLSLMTNPLVENVYEMGSIVKALTMAAALDSGAVTAKTTYNDKGSLTMNNKTIYNYDGKARGVVSMQEVLNQSLNTGVTFAMQQMGKESFKKYFLSFGLGEKTGIDLPGEGSGLVSTLNNNQDIEFATASFGQGISVTPIEMTRALATLGNGGFLVRPHVVKEIRYKTGLRETIESEIGRQVLKKTTSEEITRMLVEVVDTKLANGKAKLPHTSVAAKTGTAQMVDPSTKKYYEDRYLHSFFGYFPAYEPRYLVFLYIKNPRGVQYASETLTVPFMDITKFLLNYYSIPPDR